MQGACTYTNHVTFVKGLQMKIATPLPPVVFATIVAIGAAVAFLLHRISADVAAITVLVSSVAIANVAVWTIRVVRARSGIEAGTAKHTGLSSSFQKAASVLAAVFCCIDTLEIEEG